jgi:hypothetical protein
VKYVKRTASTKYTAEFGDFLFCHIRRLLLAHTFAEKFFRSPQPKLSTPQLFFTPDIRTAIPPARYLSLVFDRSAVSSMSTALSRAAQLKPEIRLAQAVSEFVADLSSEQKSGFESHRYQSCTSPPNVRDVMRLTAEIDRGASKRGSGGRCVGPRLTNVLQAVQQFAALGDIIVGGSQNMIACGVWSLVRLTLLVSAVNVFGLHPR